MLLSPSNVRISMSGVPSGCISITTDNTSYDQARKILSVLAESTGLPVSYQSEESAAMILSLRASDLPDASIQIIENVEIPRTTKNEFIIVAWKINIRDEKLKDLAEELRSHFEQFGLSAKVL